MQAGNPTGFSMQQRSGDQNQLDSQAQQQMIAALLKNALAAPQKPELSWTQGLARMLEAGVSSYKQNQLDQKNKQNAQDSANDAKLLGAALASNDPKQVVAAMQQMKNPIMGLNAVASMNSSSQSRQTELEKIDRQNAGKKDVAHIKTDTPDNLTKQNIKVTNDIIAATQVKIGQETDPAKKQQLQTMLGNLQETQKNYTNVIRSGKGEAPDVMKEKTGDALKSLEKAGTTPETLPIDQKTALQSSGNNPLRPETTASIENAKYATKGMDEEIKSHDQLAKSSADMTAKGNQILQVIAADPTLRSGFGTENLTTVQAALHNYFPGLIQSNNYQQLFQKLSKQLVVDASGIMRGEAGSGFRLTQNELLYIISKTVPDIASNSVEGVKYIIEATNAMNGVYSQMAGAAKAIRDNPNLSQAQKGQAMNQLQQAGLKDMETQGLNFINSKLSPTGQQVIVNPDYDPVKHPVDKYLRVSSDGQKSSFGQDNSPPESPQHNQEKNEPTTVAPPQNAPQSSSVQPQQAQPAPPQQQAQPLDQTPKQTSYGTTGPSYPDTSQQSNPAVQPAPSQNVSYQQPADSSQNIPPPSVQMMPNQPPPMDQQQMLALALAKKQQDQQIPDYSSQFTNSPDMSF